MRADRADRNLARERGSFSVSNATILAFAQADDSGAL
jgi:hypothetical protein